MKTWHTLGMSGKKGTFKKVRFHCQILLPQTGVVQLVEGKMDRQSDSIIRAINYGKLASIYVHFHYQILMIVVIPYTFASTRDIDAWKPIGEKLFNWRSHAFVVVTTIILK